MKRTIKWLAAISIVAAGGIANAQDMSFFLTSKGPGDGANLGGLDGADAHCTALAEAAGVSGKTWRAYLSTTGGEPINARDRIGDGPWVNANGVQVASDVDDLHSDDNKLSKENSVSEEGDPIQGRGDTPNRHDILTGADLMGPFEGREAIMTLYRDSLAVQTDVRRHVTTNIFFHSEDGDPLVISNLTLFATENGETRLLTAGVYRDTVRRTDKGWLLVKRHLDLDSAY